MPNKRSSRKKVQAFYCPYCENRLWRLGSEKYYLFFQEVSDLKKSLKCSTKTAKLVMINHPNHLDKNAWIEEFFCEKHGMIWLLLTRQEDGKLNHSVAQPKDWKRTTKTIDPRNSNPSVSEYTARMSRNKNKNY